MQIMNNYADTYLAEATKIIQQLNVENINKVVGILSNVKKSDGRIFFLGVGGSAANASHAVNDFRKIAGIESYAPTDNVSELTARTNDDGWDSVFVNWLIGSKLNSNDCVFIFSVGGGNVEKNISVNLVNALKYAKEKNSKIVGIVGRDGGYTAKMSDVSIIVPTVNPDSITPHTESFQSVIWHLIVTHPALKSNEMKWESTK
jgi:D-sedoheptulose 7-phosphate isomerase